MKLGRFLIVFVSILWSLQMLSQDYDMVDATIQLYPTSVDNAAELSKFITRDFSSEEDKVRAIYGWLINNVAYDPEEYKIFDYSFATYKEYNKKEAKTREKIIKRTLQKGIAVCEGYAMVFERLCELQGIRNHLVRGDTKTNFTDIGREFANNHMWNAAKINESYYLFDPTWGAGRYNGKFIKEPSYTYYKIDPEVLLKTHYPSMIDDAFTEVTMTRMEFSKIPLLINNELTLNSVIVPKLGIISTFDSEGKVAFVIKANPEKITFRTNGAQVEISEIERADGKIKFKIPIELGVETMLIYFDDAPALGYKIKW